VRWRIKVSDARILIVDDEPQLREIFGYWLTAAGCVNLHTADDGEAALALMKSTPIDLLVTDIRMPTMDGISLVRHLAEIAIPIPSIIFVSGFGDVDEKEMYSLGAEAFLSKPLINEDFMAAVEKALSERSSLWIAPLHFVPRQLVVLHAEGIGEGPDKDTIQLGRGGFSAHYTGFLKLASIAFRCSFPKGNHEIAGQGYVRWQSKTDQTIGVEFAFIEEPSRSWLVEKITTANLRSFIPG
jgi:CheY-like chemotaxis protein